MTTVQFELIDDGTLDTVLRCRICGGEERFNTHAMAEVGDDGPVEEWIDLCVEDATIYHECQIAEVN